MSNAPVNPFATAPATPASTATQPIGDVVVKLGGIVVASRSIWAESISRTQAYNDLNELAKSDPAKLIKILEANASKLTFEVRSNELNQGESFEDIINGI